MFAAWGRIVHRHRWAVLAGSAALLALSVIALARGGGLQPAGQASGSYEATRAAELIKAEIPAQQAAAGTGFELVFSSRSLRATDPGFQAALEQAVSPLRRDPRVKTVTTPYDAPPEAAPSMISNDGRAALVRVDLPAGSEAAQKEYPSLRALVSSPTLTVTGTGAVAISRAFNTTLESDLARAERVSLPVTLLLLLLIFGSVVAALLPLGVGLLTIAGGLGATLLLAHVTDVSQYALNIVTLIGLGVSIDYSLFVVSRFREELAAGTWPEAALAATVATAGRAVAFSGLTVAVGLSGLLFYQGTVLASMGAAGALVVTVAVVYALSFLPAVLAVLGPRVDRLRVRLPLRRRGGARPNFWRGLAIHVMRRPLFVLLPAIGFLLVAGSPFLGIRLANGNVDMLPARLEARQGYDALQRDFPGQGANIYEVVVDFPGGGPLGGTHVGALYDLSQRLAAIPGVSRVDSAVSVDPALGKADYERLYASPAELQPAPLRVAARSFTGPHVALLSVVSGTPPTSDAARAILKEVRAQKVPGATVVVGGYTAYDVDSVGFIERHTPLAFGFVVGVTLVVLFLLTGSVVLPLKAVLTNLVSISASFGALVWIFQQGHLSGLLGFTPQPLDPTIPVLLFATVFGLSMDYEVLLVTRIQEKFRETQNNAYAVALGLERSGAMITGAAAIMVAVFVAFGLAEVVLIKAIGVGLAIAVALDATVVRGLLVPSVMRLLGDHNWWAPRLLRRLHERVGISEPAPPPPAPAAPRKVA